MDSDSPLSATPANLMALNMAADYWLTCIASRKREIIPNKQKFDSLFKY